MMTKNVRPERSVVKTVRDIRRPTRRNYSAEEKIRIVLEGLRGGESIAGLCRREGLIRISVTAGRKNFWKLGRND